MKLLFTVVPDLDEKLFANKPHWCIKWSISNANKIHVGTLLYNFWYQWNSLQGIVYPEGVAYPVGGVGREHYVLLDIHYDNPNNVEGKSFIST